MTKAAVLVDDKRHFALYLIFFKGNYSPVMRISSGPSKNFVTDHAHILILSQGWPLMVFEIPPPGYCIFLFQKAITNGWASRKIRETGLVHYDEFQLTFDGIYQQNGRILPFRYRVTVGIRLSRINGHFLTRTLTCNLHQSEFLRAEGSCWERSPTYIPSYSDKSMSLLSVFFMSIKSMTMSPPISRNLIWRAISSAAWGWPARMPSPGPCAALSAPELTSMTCIASVFYHDIGATAKAWKYARNDDLIWRLTPSWSRFAGLPRCNSIPAFFGKLTIR